MTGTIKFLRELFSKYGILDIIISDNGTQFMSEEFQNFCKIYAVKHVITPPYHP